VKFKIKTYVTSSINFGGKKITTSMQYKNLYGVQFHPEKSGENGINIIKNFLDQAK
jgi:glutamine amidotransferase